MQGQPRCIPVVMAVVLAAAALAGCRSRAPIDPLALEGNWLTISNLTADDWTDVDISLNTHYHFRVRGIQAGGRDRVPLDGFVAGYGQRFDVNRAQIHDIRLSARRPNGQPLELVKQFERGGLAGALEGMQRRD